MSHTFLIQFFKRKIKKMKVSKFLQQKKKSATKYQTRISTLTKLKILLPDCLFTNSLTHLLTEWLIYLRVLIDWCTDWMIYLLTGWMSCCLTYFVTSQDLRTKAWIVPPGHLYITEQVCGRVSWVINWTELAKHQKLCWGMPGSWLLWNKATLYLTSSAVIGVD